MSLLKKERRRVVEEMQCRKEEEETKAQSFLQSDRVEARCLCRKSGSWICFDCPDWEWVPSSRASRYEARLYSVPPASPGLGTELGIVSTITA